jgi:coronatine-insensitive protein 1
LTAVAVGCRGLEYIAAYVSDITNGALESIGTFCKNLYDFRVVLLDRERDITIRNRTFTLIKRKDDIRS